MAIFTKVLNGFFGGGDPDKDDHYAPAREKGQKGGYHSTEMNRHPKETYDALTGLSKHEREVFEYYLLHGQREAAKILDINPKTLHKIVNVVKDKLDLRGFRDEVTSEYTAQFDVDINIPYTNYDHTSTNYTDPTVEGGDHPWLYDSEGNYIG